MSPALPLDPKAVRSFFPAFSDPSLEGWAFFECAGGSYTAHQVLDRLNTYYTGTKVQPYSVYPASRDAGAAMDLAYERLAQALNVPTDWVHIGPSSSGNAYVLAQALGEWLEPGDTIIVTNQDHEANSGALRRLASRGVTIREWQVNPQSGHLDPAQLDTLIDDNVKVAAFPHCSNIVGEINPVAAICQKLRTAGIVSIVDGVSYAPHGLPDITALGPDVYFFSAYKTFGPHQGVMTVRRSLLDALPNQGHFFNADQPRKRLNPAGPDHAQIAACAGVADYLEALAALSSDGAGSPFRKAERLIHDQEQHLLAPLMEYLRGRNDIRLIGPADPARRAPTVALALDEPGAGVARRLAEHKIMASGGHFYAWRLLQALGIDPQHGVLRLSFVHYTSPEEIDRLIKALDVEI